MSEYTAEGEFELSVEALWAAVSDFGDLSWLPGKPIYSSEGEGPGMVRILNMSPIPEVREQLDEIDEDHHTIFYRVIAGVPMPITDYQASMQVVDAGQGRSRLIWSSKWEPDGVSEEEATQVVSNMYKNVMAAMKSKLERG